MVVAAVMVPCELVDLKPGEVQLWPEVVAGSLFDFRTCGGRIVVACLGCAIDVSV